MRIQKAGFLTPSILLLGSQNFCMYLIKGDDFALLGGGVAWEVPLLEEQLDRFKISRHRIRYLVISHAHHDHCSATPYLIRRYPWIRTIASPYCARNLNREDIIAVMDNLTRKTLDLMKKPHSFEGFSLRFCRVPISIQAKDGDRLELGENLNLTFFQTPGHSRCSLSAYLPQEQALFPGDSIPIPEIGNRRTLTVTANHDYDDYIQSLKKLAPLSIRLIGYEHGGAITGEDLEGIIDRALEATLEQRERIRRRYQELNDLDLLVKEVADKYLSMELFKLAPRDLVRAMTKRMVKSALGLLSPR